MPAARGLILVGQVAGAFGVKGEVRVTAYTADPASLLDYAALCRADGSPALTLVSGRANGASVIARAREVSSREEAQALRGLALYIRREDLPPPDEDEFYLADLVGLRAASPAGDALGTVKSVQNFGAGDLLEIAPADGTPSWWAPFTRQAVPEIRLGDGLIIVDRPPETEAREDEPER